MTISDTTPYVNLTYTGAGTYSFSFLAQLTTDVVVEHTTTAGVTSTLVVSTDYSITLNPSTPGGDVVTTYATTSGTLTIRRVTPITQAVDWVNNDAFDMTILENSQDKTMASIQELSAVQAKTIRLDFVAGTVDALPTPVGDGVWKWNAAATAIEWYALGDIAADAASAAAEAVDAAASAAAALVSENAAAADLALTNADVVLTNADVVSAEAARVAAVAAQAAAEAANPPLNNFVATTDPAVTDDSGDGYGIGSRWVNLTTDASFTCVDATVGAAVWSSGGGGYSYFSADLFSG